VKFPPGTPVVLRHARSWHGTVVRFVEPAQSQISGYVVSFGVGPEVGFGESELMEDPTVPHQFVDGPMYGPGKCAFSGCGTALVDDVHSTWRIEIEIQRRAYDAESRSGDAQ
jgi:hypothetical protein